MYPSSLTDPNRAYIIAEAGVNHNGDPELARRLIDAARQAGASAVKFQTFKAEKIVSPKAAKADYQKRQTGENESQLAMLRRLELAENAHFDLMAYCRETGILFLSTPFDAASADMLETLGMPVFKIGSGEITNLPFLQHIAQKKKPIILSTGMSYLSEIDLAVRSIRESGCPEIALLHCVSNYPADPRDVNLRAMGTLANAFQLPVGFSDHTRGFEIALAAVAMGARIIEKHLTLDRSLPGPDHRASLEPEEFKAMIQAIRTVESALGNGRKEPAPGEFEIRTAARRSLVAAKDLKAGTRLTPDMIDIKRPGTGFAPAMKSFLIGRSLRVDIPAGTVFDGDMLQ